MQHRNKTNWSPLVPDENKLISTKHWVLRMVRMIPAEPHEPLFLVRDAEERHPLTSSQINRLLNRWCTDAGVDPKDFTSHCLRRGGINWAHQAKLTGKALKILGGWGSSAYMSYLDLDFESRVKSTKKMVQAAKSWNKTE